MTFGNYIGLCIQYAVRVYVVSQQVRMYYGSETVHRIASEQPADDHPPIACVY